jgi:hypothetical protein
MILDDEDQVLLNMPGENFRAWYMDRQLNKGFENEGYTRAQEIT